MSINRIIADVKNRGIARPNLFRVRINLPSRLRLSLPENGGSSFDNAIAKVLNATAGTVNQRFLDLSCENAALPARNFTTTPERAGSYGPRRAYPNAQEFNDITLTFRCSSNMEEKKFFDDWQHMVMDPYTHEFNYYDEYTSDLEIIQEKQGVPFLSIFGEDATSQNRFLDEFAATFTGLNDVYSVKLFECYPSLIDALPLSHEGNNSYHRLNVTFQYRKWLPGGLKLRNGDDNGFFAGLRSAAGQYVNDNLPIQSSPFGDNLKLPDNVFNF